MCKRRKRMPGSFATAAVNARRERDEWRELAEEAEQRAVEAERERAAMSGKAAPRPAEAAPERDELARAIDLSSAAGALRTLEAFYPDRVEVLPQALASADDYRSTDMQTTWRIALSAATDIWPLAFGGSQGRLADDYAARTGFELTWHEGSMTSKNPRMSGMRSVTDKGRTFDISAHVKGRGKDRLRMHFAIDRDARKVVIGHFGTHMETVGSRKRGYKR